MISWTWNASIGLEMFCFLITLRYLLFFLAIQNNNGAGSWDLSMEQCRNSQPSTYLLGDFNLNSPQMVCVQIPIEIQLFWVGVARHVFPSIDQGKYQILLLERFFKFHKIKFHTNNHYTYLLITEFEPQKHCKFVNPVGVDLFYFYVHLSINWSTKYLFLDMS